MLICFASYLCWSKFDPSSPSHIVSTPPARRRGSAVFGRCQPQRARPAPQPLPWQPDRRASPLAPAPARKTTDVPSRPTPLPPLPPPPPSPPPPTAPRQSFPDWAASRPELRSVLSHMLRRNPMAALEMHVPAATLPPGTPPRPLDDEASAHLIRAVRRRRRRRGRGGQPPARPTIQGGRVSPAQSRPQGMHAFAPRPPPPPTRTPQAEDQAETIISSRLGRVLGALTILKEDYFPGMKSQRLPQPLPGASNFRAMAGARVYGVAMSTVGGIRNVLKAVKEQQRGGREGGELLWFNMREEPVVYVNGRPFVLREQACPMKNLQEYAGIDATRLERMERRLKEDVLAEAGEGGAGAGGPRSIGAVHSRRRPAHGPGTLSSPRPPQTARRPQRTTAAASLWRVSPRSAAAAAGSSSTRGSRWRARTRCRRRPRCTARCAERGTGCSTSGAGARAGRGGGVRSFQPLQSAGFDG
jgi:hypothetical protein